MDEFKHATAVHEPRLQQSLPNRVRGLSSEHPAVPERSGTTKRAPSFSLVVPCKDEAANIGKLVQEIRADFGAYPADWEVLFVDDGSSDDTYAAIRQATEGDPHFVAIKLAMNLGKSAAYMAGFAHARHEVVATMDGDLQDRPADVLRLVAEIGEGADLALGWKQTGKSSIVKWLLSIFFNLMIRIRTGLALHDMNCPLRAMRRETALKLNLYGSLFRYIPVFVANQNGRIVELSVENRDRRHGTSKYTYGKYPKALGDFVTAVFVTKYAESPLHFFGKLGLVSVLIGVAIDAYICYLFFAGWERAQDNLPSLLLGVLFIVIGIQFVTTGLLGEMLVRNSNRANPSYKDHVERVDRVQPPA